MMWPLVRKDILLWIRVPQSLLVTVFIPMVIMTVAILADTVQQRMSVAVTDSSGSAQVVTSEIESSPYFHAIPADFDEAETWLQNGDILAVVNIPADYNELLASGQRVTIEMKIKNRDEDLTRNFILRLYDVVVKANARLLASAVDVEPILTIQERPLLPQPVSDARYLATGILVFIAIYGGLANTALLMAREWDESVVKEVLLAPRSYSEFVIAKIFTGWLETLLSIIIIFLFAFFIIGLQPVGNFWVIAAFLIMTALFGAAIGALLGCVIRQIIPAVMLSIAVSTLSWLIGGGFGPVAFTSKTVQKIAWVLPPTYTVTALQQLMHTTLTTNLGNYALVIGVSTLVALVICLVVCNRMLTQSPLE